jgi:hypothetical protein
VSVFQERASVAHRVPLTHVLRVAIDLLRRLGNVCVEIHAVQPRPWAGSAWTFVGRCGCSGAYSLRSAVPWVGCRAIRQKGEREVLKTRVQPRLARILVAGLGALVLSGAFLENPAHSRGAGNGPQPSSKVAVVPGFAPKPYSGNSGAPPLPVNAPELANYHFTELPAANVTAAALKGYDTVLLYGILWSDIPSAGQAAINSFAATHKVVIWDSDATGAQTYSNFIHPFSTLSSGQNYKGKPNASVVSYPTGVNFLASDQPASPYYLEPYEFVHDTDQINDMNAMVTGTKNWRPALVGANETIPNGGWTVAWSYGAIANGTGMTIYSGIDADGFASHWKLNNVTKEVALDLAAPFRTTSAGCAPGCQLPPPGSGNPHAACSFAKPLPKHWVHRRVRVVLKSSAAAGITAQIVTSSGRVVAKGKEGAGALVRLVVRTTKLPSNRMSRLRALVFVNGKQACSNNFRLKVDNVRPRLLEVATTRRAVDVLTLRVSERSWLRIVGRHAPNRTVRIPAHRTIHLRFLASLRTGKLVLWDRARNTVVRRLVWR